MTKFPEIKKWWEMIMSAYLMISLNTEPFLSLNTSALTDSESSQKTVDVSLHKHWHQSQGWKNVLNNFRLIIQPTVLLWLIFPWLDVFPNSSLLLGLHDLIAVVNQLKPFYLFGCSDIFLTN